ncbi:MAG: NifB/NifX family molybdenum-iron cluster-binding protein [Bacteroidota bacterium]
MKIAIASNGNSLESTLDKSFGRCAYFIIFDSENGALEFIPNPNKNMEENAGPASVQLVASKSVTKIVSFEFGLKIKPLLDSLKIQMIILKEPGKQIRDIIDLLNH